MKLKLEQELGIPVVDGVLDAVILQAIVELGKRQENEKHIRS
jgi:Asp/Glu/hydantoin racemase